jgi:hypothetical protein
MEASEILLKSSLGVVSPCWSPDDFGIFVFKFGRPKIEPKVDEAFPSLTAGGRAGSLSLVQERL